MAAPTGPPLPDAKKADAGGVTMPINLLQALPPQPATTMTVITENVNNNNNKNDKNDNNNNNNMKKDEAPPIPAEPLPEGNVVAGAFDEKKLKELKDAAKEEQNKEKEDDDADEKKPEGGAEVEHKPKQKKKKRIKKKKKKLARELLKADTMVQSTNNETACLWRVKCLLGSGGFGDVYKVVKENSDDKKEYAMKTEVCLDEKQKRMMRLKVEVAVMDMLKQPKQTWRKWHFLQLIDKGKIDEEKHKFKYMVMNLVGPSIDDIRKKKLKANFSHHSAYFIAIQTLDSIRDLHDLGWLHRDIKPQNFAIGLEETSDTIYMLDFGIAKYVFEKDTKEMKLPRKYVKFLGTTRFASRACHTGKEQGRKDDLETWLYMIYDVLDMELGLPWKKIIDKDQILRKKENFFDQCGKVKSVPESFQEIAKYINGMNYSSLPDYQKISNIFLHNVAPQLNINMNKKPDWFEARTAEKKKTADGKDESSSGGNHQSGSASNSDKDKKSGDDKRKKTKTSSSRERGNNRVYHARHHPKSKNTTGGTTQGATSGDTGDGRAKGSKGHDKHKNPGKKPEIGAGIAKMFGMGKKK